MSKLKYISIISPQYSGSTLLAFSLCSHGKASTLGEYNFFSRFMFNLQKQEFLCSCGQEVYRCEHWNTLKEFLQVKFSESILKLNFSNFNFYTSKQIDQYYHKLLNRLKEYGLLTRTPSFLLSRYHDICHINYSLLKKQTELTGTNCVVDTSKSIFNCIYLEPYRNIDSYAIRLVRDGRAQMWSAMVHAKKNNRVRAPQEAARRWKNKITTQKKILDYLGPPAKLVKYEDLCFDFKGTMEAILNFTGLEKKAGDSQNDFNTSQHAYGNFNVLHSGEQKIVDKQIWRENLTDEDLAIYYEIAGDLHDELGYSRD